MREYKGKGEKERGPSQFPSAHTHLLLVNIREGAERRERKRETPFFPFIHLCDQIQLPKLMLAQAVEFSLTPLLHASKSSEEVDLTENTKSVGANVQSTYVVQTPYRMRTVE